MEDRDVTIVRARGQITVPSRLRRAVGLEEGDAVEMIRTDEGILLRPKKLVDADQAWFWTTEWQAGEREASTDIEAGRTRTYPTERAFVSSLAPGSGRVAETRTRYGKARARRSKS